MAVTPSRLALLLLKSAPLPPPPAAALTVRAAAALTVRALRRYVTDYRNSYVNTTNGKIPKYYCVRLSPNGRDVRQLCDPTTLLDGTGEMTGAVRAATEELWGDLKRGHFIDSFSRTMSITLQLKSNHVGVRYRITLLLELTSTGAILPSYDVETRILDDKATDDMLLYATISLVTVLFFAFLELIEIARSGFYAYTSDLWNVMDWTNFFFFFLAYMQVLAVHNSIKNPDCSSYLCDKMGYFDDWKLMAEYRDAKKYLSLCICIQLFKVIKYLSQLVPKMSLMTSVLRTCVIDLFFFGIVFFISLVAFSMMLYVQLGPVTEDFYDQTHAAISLFRALFGDFDIDEIMDNSSGYLNASLFLGYLFVAVFIMLSLFLAILAEAQAQVRETENKRKEDPKFNEYGVVALAYQYAETAIHKINPWARPPEVEHASAPDDVEPTIDDKLNEMRDEVNAIGESVKQLAGVVAALRTDPPAALVGGGADAPDAPADDDGGAGPGVEEARAMREVVVALDAKLTQRLQHIDERLAKRDHKSSEHKAGRNGTRSRPGRAAAGPVAATAPLVMNGGGAANGTGDAGDVAGSAAAAQAQEVASANAAATPCTASPGVNGELRC